MCVGGAGFAARWRLVFGLGLGPSVAVTIVAAFAGFAPMFWNASGRAILGMHRAVQIEVEITACSSQGITELVGALAEARFPEAVLFCRSGR
jgi:hypothetical protein